MVAHAFATIVTLKPSSRASIPDWTTQPSVVPPIRISRSASSSASRISRSCVIEGGVAGLEEERIARAGADSRDDLGARARGRGFDEGRRVSVPAAVMVVDVHDGHAPCACSRDRRRESPEAGVKRAQQLVGVLVVEEIDGVDHEQYVLRAQPGHRCVTGRAGGGRAPGTCGSRVRGSRRSDVRDVIALGESGMREQLARRELLVPCPVEDPHLPPDRPQAVAACFALSLLSRVAIFSTSRSVSFSSFKFASSSSTAFSSPRPFAIRRSDSYAAIS